MGERASYQEGNQFHGKVRGGSSLGKHIPDFIEFVIVFEDETTLNVYEDQKELIDYLTREWERQEKKILSGFCNMSVDAMGYEPYCRIIGPGLLGKEVKEIVYPKIK